MQQLKIKVCGLRDPKNIEEIAALRPDYIGFIFWRESKRWVGKDFDPGHLNLLQAETKACGVFVNEYIPTLLDRVDYYHFDAVQLHGEESPDYCKKIRAKLEGVEIIKAFSVDASFDFSALSAYQDSVDYFLFDAKGSEKGGNGTTFDWSILKNYTLETPYFLSGGIAPPLAEQIKGLAQGSPTLFGVDLNSKFETAPGFKSSSMITPFVEELR